MAQRCCDVALMAAGELRSGRTGECRSGPDGTNVVERLQMSSKTPPFGWPRRHGHGPCGRLLQGPSCGRCNSVLTCQQTISPWHGAVAYCKKVDDSKNHHEDPRRDHDLPKRLAQGFRAGSLFVEVPENKNTKHNHCKSQGDEARRWREEWPISRDVIAKQREFGDDEKHLIEWSVAYRQQGIQNQTHCLRAP